MFARAPLKMRVVAHRVTKEAVFIGGISDLVGVFALCMQAPPAVATLAVRVIGRDLGVSLDFVVTDLALDRSNTQGAFDRGRAAPLTGLPIEGGAGNACQNPQEDRQAMRPTQDNRRPSSISA